MYSFYIIFSKKLNRYYIGHTENIEDRIIQHNAGLSKYTSKANDWKLVFSEEYETREAARKREVEIKRKKSRRYIEWRVLNKV